MTQPKPTILVVDDEVSIVEALQRVLAKEGHHVLTANNGREALEVLRKSVVDVMITDLRMPGMAGDDLLKAVKVVTPEVEVVVMTAYGTVENAVNVMKLGAYDFISKPLKRAAVVAAVSKALDKRALVVENRELRKQLKAVTTRSIVGNSQIMRATLEIAEQAAQSSATVLLLGESGTGKELMARYIHEKSARTDKPFIATNCAALPESILEAELFGHEKGAFTGAIRSREGRFTQADSGTLFLDEIGDVPLPLQVKFLRALQEGEVDPIGGRTKKVDIRLVVATNRDLQGDIKAGRFREDLFYRINVVPITLPTLRDRAEDIPLLADHFLRKYSAKHGRSLSGFSDAALERMGQYGWPGNVRELENAVERMVVLCRGSGIDVGDLPGELRDPSASQGRQLTFSVGTPIEEMERRMIMETLKFTRGDKRLAADLLGIATRTIYRKLESGFLREENYEGSQSSEGDSSGTDDGVLH